MIPLLLLCASCTTSDPDPIGEPAAPSANGTVALAPGTDATGFTALEIHWNSVDASYPDDVYSIEQDPTFPMFFEIGRGIGVSDATTYRLSMWLTNGSMPATGPAAGAPHATMDVEVPICTDGCISVDGLSVVLAP